ncbi:glucosidase family protein [Mucilaginibacter pedocola]|uniref:Uncharacterized protein n=1 Tax=Mucilaginibacter pedocola TaxID=1792845 RepID=A0A1S9P726_9SPHI|nr:hypothetical protein [Mucilaginibacter pedocola]OOQ56762.1 hypothetical protein BC343_17385 [Mucilaginibacter pedocola]
MLSRFKFCLSIIFVIALLPKNSQAATGNIIHNKTNHTIAITGADGSLKLIIDYTKGCVVKQLFVKGKNKLSPLGIYSGIGSATSLNTASIQVSESKNAITISGIKYGDVDLTITETWLFKLNGNTVDWVINRNYDKNAKPNDMAFPKWNFADMNTWKGGIMDNGGMVWCKYLKAVGDTYGVHTAGVTFWDASSGDGLAIKANAGQGQFAASKYSQGPNGEFTFTQLATTTPLRQRYDQSRFVSQKTDVFAPGQVKKGGMSMHLSLSYVNYFEKYSRGNLPGIDAAAVRELLNTTGRYGVVDNNIVGGNGWTTNWKCLHEPFFAQVGMAINDPNYTRNFSATLNQERDEAMLPDGRVLSRWHNAAGDEIPGTYNPKTGYYEAMWGYTIDSQTGYIINLSEQFDITGDVNWLRTHRESAEKALAWLIKRDANGNGIFEMMNNNIAEHKASDWLDIVWASYENAFVNAQMYEALTLWAECERVMGDSQKSGYYKSVALKLKTAFNKPVEEGGFWSAAKKQYVYWRDNDGSVHGDNLVTPVNFAAIAFGLCDDPKRIEQVLGQIEQRTVAENLFHWPLCFESFKREEVQSGNWPFPKYENGDIFPTWGYLGIRAYVGYDKAIALKYINNILKQYNKDGLSSQRYSRVTQLGQGDDILSGICTSITALYRDIYGIRPKWNRMGIEPNMVASLNGTAFNYTLRGTEYHIALSTNNYRISAKGFNVSANEGFGVAKNGNKLTYYHQNKEEHRLELLSKNGIEIKLNVNRWDNDSVSWKVASTGLYTFKLTGMSPGREYTVAINNKNRVIKATAEGDLQFNHNGPAIFIVK